MKNRIMLGLSIVLTACSQSTPPAKPPQPKVEAAPSAAPTAVVATATTPAPEAPKADPNKELAGRVKRALEAPGTELTGGAIDVTAADGKVTLWGAVPTERERSRAAQLAGEVNGVRSVDNQLKVVKGS